MRQGLAIPFEEYKRGSDRPRWFGPLKRKFKGFPDLFGFEFVDGVPVFCLIEVKTKKDTIKKDQKNVLEWLSGQGCRCYLAKEDDSETGFSLSRLY